MLKLKTAVSLAVLALLAACGGGGDGGGDAAGTPVVPATGALQITSANYVTVADEAVSSTSYVADSSQFVTGAQVSARPALAVVAWSQFARLQRHWSAAQALVTGATMTESMQCSGGGRLDATMNDLNGNQDLDAGESASMVAVGCVESGTTLNGRLDFTLKSLTGDMNGTIYTASIGVTLDKFSVATSGGSESGSGTMAIDIASSGVNAGTLKVSVDSLSLTGSFGGISDTVSMKNFVFDETLSPMGSGARSSSSVSGVFSSSAFGGQPVTLSTVSPLVTLPDDAYPSSGQMLATGLAGSKVRLSAHNASTALIELDADGDAVYETSVSKAWSSLF